MDSICILIILRLTHHSYLHVLQKITLHNDLF